MKSMRVITAIALIPTFAFLALSLCCCPSAQAKPIPQGELSLTSHGCCCPSEGKCADESLTVSKESAVSVDAVHVAKPASAESAGFVLKVESPKSVDSVKLVESSPPLNLLQVNSVQLLI